MALQRSFTSAKYGVTFPKAYAKITRFSGDKERMNIIIGWFASQEARLAGKEPVALATYVMPVTPKEPAVADGQGKKKQSTPTELGLVAELYTYLKSLPDFKDAADI